MKRTINYYFLTLSLFLIVFGLLFLSTLSAIASLQIFGNTNYYLFHQLVGVLVGIALGFIAFKIPLDFLKKITPVLFIVNVLSMIAVFFPVIGTTYWGASRWISIGSFSFNKADPGSSFMDGLVGVVDGNDPLASWAGSSLGFL